MNIKVFGELLLEMLEKEPNHPLLDHIIICIYGLLKKHIMTLVSTYLKKENIYNDIKALIFECVKKRYLNLKNPSNLIRKNICDCISILIISGITCSWKTCIIDLINEAKNGDNELTFITLRSIADCDLVMNFFKSENDDEYWDDSLNLEKQEKDRIKDKLIEHSALIFNFIYEDVYLKINNFEKNLKNRIIKSIIDLINFWTKLNLNILTNQNIYKIILELINMTDEENEKIENIKSIAELISKSIVLSKNSKLYEFYYKIEENSDIENILQNINDNIDIEEKKGIDIYLDYILEKLNEYNNSKNKDENILWAYAKIFSAILENYVYFFFDFSNKRTGIAFQWLKYFITHKKRKISWLFFNSIESMMIFISDYYRFYGLNSNQIDEFSGYLIDLLYGVMKNCEYKKLKSNDFSELQKEILYNNSELIWTTNKNFFNGNVNEEDSDIDDIDIREYRNAAENVFYCMYLIFKDGLNKKYETIFINKILSLINLNEQNFNINFDESIAKLLDIILLVLKSLIKVIDIESSPEIIGTINDFIYQLCDTVYIQNINIFIDYLIFINQFGKCLDLDKKYLEKALLILLLVSDKNDIEKCLIDSCYVVLNNLCSELHGSVEFVNIFNKFLERFIKIYNNYNINNIYPLNNLISSMFLVIGVNRDYISDDANQSNLIPFIQKICQPVIAELHTLLEQQNNLSNVQFIEQLKFGIMKSFALYKEILYHISLCNHSLKRDVVNDFISNSIKDLITIFKIFPNDMDIFNSIIGFYSSNSSIIGEYCLDSFPLLNNIFMELFKSNKNFYQIIDLLGFIYKIILRNLNKKDENYLQQNKYILDNLLELSKYSIQYLNEEKEFNKQFIDKIKIFALMINDNFSLIYIPNEQSNNEIFQDIFSIISFIINIINVLIKNKDNIIEDNTISIIIKSISSLLNENFLKYLLINSQNNEYKDFIKSIISNTLRLLDLTKFNFLSSQELSSLYYNIIKCGYEIFNEIFNECLLSINLFNKDYVNNICNYLSFYNNEKDSIIRFFNELFSIIYEKKGLDCLEFYFNCLKRKKNL